MLSCKNLKEAKGSANPKTPKLKAQKSDRHCVSALKQKEGEGDQNFSPDAEQVVGLLDFQPVNSQVNQRRQVGSTLHLELPKAPQSKSRQMSPRNFELAFRDRQSKRETLR